MAALLMIRVSVKSLFSAQGHISKASAKNSNIKYFYHDHIHDIISIWIEGLGKRTTSRYETLYL